MHYSQSIVDMNGYGCSFQQSPSFYYMNYTAGATVYNGLNLNQFFLVPLSTAPDTTGQTLLSYFNPTTLQILATTLTQAQQ